MSTQLIFLRHGQSEANERNIIAGIYDAKITRKGIKQAKSAAKELKNTPIDAVYSSPLARAEVTAAIVAKSKGLPVFIEKDLEEIHSGVYEGMKFSGRWPEEVEFFFSNFVDAAMEGGEATKQAALRIYGAVEKIAKKHDGKTVLIATHAGILQAFCSYVYAECDLSKMKKPGWMKNTALTYVLYDGKMTIQRYADATHLARHGLETVELMEGQAGKK